MTKYDMMKELSGELGVSITEATKYFDTVFAVITKNLLENREVKISEFGSFHIKIMPERQGRNPSTGETIEIAAKNKVTFKPFSTLKTIINS